MGFLEQASGALGPSHHSRAPLQGQQERVRLKHSTAEKGLDSPDAQEQSCRMF
jgi:hypothetical protein